MDTRYYIANWKSNKTKEEARLFLQGIKEGIGKIDLEGKKIILAPPFTLLDFCSQYIKEHSLPISLASQNVSSFPSGAYTGEVNARQIKEFAGYTIVSHSERLRYLHESESDIENKVREALNEGLIVIQCIQDEMSKVHKDITIVAYEPVSAIGTGDPDDPDHISKVFDEVLRNNPSVKVLYGGSVNPQTISQFKSIGTLSGFLIGGASLDSTSFLSLLNG